MKTRAYIFTAGLMFFVFTFGIWRSLEAGSSNNVPASRQAAWSNNPAVFLPYTIKAPLATPTPTSTLGLTCPPTPTKIYICGSATPCPPGNHRECPNPCSCLGGCGYHCVPDATRSPTITVTVRPAFTPTLTEPPP